MNQTWENDKKTLISGPNLGPQNFFHWFYLYCMFDIVASYHYMQFQGKLTNQTWEKGKKPSFRTNFGTFGPNLGPKIFFIDFTSTKCYTLLQAIMASNSRKINEPNWQNGKKTSFRTNFGPFGPNLGPKNLLMNFTSTIC